MALAHLLPSKPVSDSEIAARIKQGERFVKKFAQNDLQASRRYIDASNSPYFWTGDGEFGEEGDVQQSQPVGQSNLLTTAIVTKIAAITVGDPDWFVRTADPDNDYQPNAESSQIGREFLRESWRKNNWVRVSQKVLQKRFVAGLGICQYRWCQDDGKEGYVEFDPVPSWDFCLDPHTTDLSNIRWAGRKIRMPLSEAISTYGAEHFNAH